MAAAGYSVGRDLTMVVVNQVTGAAVKWATLCKADFRQMTKQLEWKPLNGNIAFADLPGGWEVNLELDRSDGSVQDYFVLDENNYLSGGTTTTFYLQETITNPDGSVSQYRYINGAMKLSNAGSFAMDDKVSLKVDARFGRCMKVA